MEDHARVLAEFSRLEADLTHSPGHQASIASIPGWCFLLSAFKVSIPKNPYPC